MRSEETFLRALRAQLDPPRPRDDFRAWVLTIGVRVAIDTTRARGSRRTSSRNLAHSDEGVPPMRRPAFLTDTLPPKERAAVVLRYGYDLDYAQIAAALDSSAEAARQATSSGVRRLRRRIT